MAKANEALVAFLKENENDALAAGDLKWLRHSSPEGGTDTIGYGHKLTGEEIKSGKVHGFQLDRLDLAAVDAILKVDIANKTNSAAKKFKKITGRKWGTLSPRKQMMLTDYEFNLRGGLNTFPSFTQAVADNDDPRQKDEMIRTFKDPQGVTKPLARNNNFYNTFMSTSAKKRLGE